MEKKQYSFSSGGGRIIQAMMLLGSENVWDRGLYEESIITCTPEEAAILHEMTGFEPKERI